MSEQFHSGLHPDADLLNAFLEGGLPEHERVACLAHLAECAECREVASLAGQAAAVEQPLAVPARKPPVWQRLFRPLPVMVAFVATVVTLFTFGLYRMIRSAEKPPVTASVKAPAENSPAAVPTPQPAPEGSEPPVAKTAPHAVVNPRPELQETVKAPDAQPAASASAPGVAPAPASSAPASPPPPPPAPAANARALTPVLPEVVGKVTDRAGGVVPNAQVELKNQATGAAVASTKSDARGEFSIAGFSPGKYDLSITAPGFKSFVEPSVDVQSQQIARLNSTLDVGTSTETVTVTDQAALLKTESGAVSRRANTAPAESLPLTPPSKSFSAPPGYTLPGNSKPVSFAVKGKTVVACDAAGALFISIDEGKTWDRIKGKWKGKVARVAAAPDGFQLSTDPPSTWASADGRKWSKIR